MISRVRRRIASKVLGSIFLLLVCWLVGSETALGQGNLTIPAGAAGYNVKVIAEPFWTGIRSGTFLIEIEKRPRVNAVKDEHLTVSVEGSAGFEIGADARCFSKQVILPAGSRSVAVEIAFQPQLISNRFFQVRLEKGAGDGRFNSNDLVRSYYLPFSPERQGFVFLDSKIKSKPASVVEFVCWEGMQERDLSTMGWNGMPATTNAPNVIQNLSSFLGSNVGYVVNDLGISVCGFEEMPEDLQGWGSIDNIAIRFDELKKFCANEVRREKLEKWVAAGGNLIVIGDGDFGYVPNLYKVLLGSEDRFPRPKQHWVGVEYSKPKDAAPSMRSYQFTSRYNRASVSADAWPTTQTISSRFKDVSLFRNQYCVGHVFAFRSNQAQRKSPTDFQIFKAELSTAGRAIRPSVVTEVKAVASPIPGAGNPPILLFIGLVFGFLLLIGPFMIVYVRRRGGYAYRLFFAVPIFSFLTCSMILGYSYITSLGSQKGRVQSFTRIHPVTGIAFNQTTLAYFCGSQPPSYRYDEDTFVMTEVGIEDRLLNMVDLEGNQIVSSDRISPRRLHFVVAEQTELTKQRLVIRQVDEKTVARNQLGSRIQLAVFQSGGDYYLIKDVAEGETVQAEQKTCMEIHDAIEQLDLDYSPPANFFSHGVSQFFYGTECHSLRQGLYSTFNIEPSEGTKQKSPLLTVDNDFLAFVDEDPMATKVSEPFNYKMRTHIIHGKQ